ncbi:esterase-like activity of phytase family protein [Roseomonas gilardii subsp. gilardii]|uniref:esterase-like activity of phytase family protein n=1 Tax=Roseomonas gilardii TaxID=257708 RepID=UPI001FF8E239|nr:esterase-like activity of phytase family protein [Roseomonas gilardii]UPG74208.1 esterase-like activity of phytase family protein [Roseomonas gilardii subsp. gilardii]
MPNFLRGTVRASFRALLLGGLVTAASTATLALPGRAQAAEQGFEAVLAGHAVLPANTLAQPPGDAPVETRVSGRFTGPGNLRTDQVGGIPGTTGPAPDGRPTGLSLPFQGQPVQGFSGIKPVAGEPGAYWVLTDNGFGTKRNSSDALLAFRKIRPDFATGAVQVEQTVFLSDPERKVPFRITHEATERRYLTGADFDPESIQPVADGFWIGEEFGPFLIHVDREGRVRRVVETKLDGQVLMSPDHPALSTAATPNAVLPFRARRSGGFEGMALTPDGKTLWAMLEKPLFKPGSDQAEGNFLRVFEFSLEKGDWTGRVKRFRLAEGAVSIGDFNFIDDRRALVIERDDGEGDPSRACASGAKPPACFATPARVKRVTLIDMEAEEGEGEIRRIGGIDLMAIRDPKGLARQRGDTGLEAGRFSFPFVTIENVARVDDTHIIVANDNNLPFSAGRFLTRADDNEFMLLSVPELLQAR